MADPIHLTEYLDPGITGIADINDTFTQSVMYALNARPCLS